MEPKYTVKDMLTALWLSFILENRELLSWKKGLRMKSGK